MGGIVGYYDGTKRTPLIARYPALPIRSYPGQSCYIRLLVFNITKIEIHSSCEIEYFAETHLCKLCVIRAIGVSHTACKDECRQNIRSHSWSVF